MTRGGSCQSDGVGKGRRDGNANDLMHEEEENMGGRLGVYKDEQIGVIQEIRFQ